MAGYSGTPLVQKLGIKPGHRVSVVGDANFVPPASRKSRDMAHPSFHKTLGPLAENASFVGSTAEDVDVIVAFETELRDFRKQLPLLANRIKSDGMIWVAWPKKASGVATDVGENAIRDYALTLGLVDIKVCAIDETWSGLKLVVRKENRAKKKTAGR